MSEYTLNKKKTHSAVGNFTSKCIKLYDFYIGDYAKYKNRIVDDRFLNSIAGEEIKTWFSWVPIIEKIIHVVSNTYTEPAKRFLVTKSESKPSIISKIFKRNRPEKENKIYEEIQQHSKMICYMPELERLVNLLGTIVVKVSWRNGGIVYDSLLPQNVVVVTDPEDPTIPIKISYNGLANVDDKNEIVTHTWTKDNYSIYNSKGVLIKNPDNTENLNPYKDKDGNGVLPFVVIRKRYYTGGFFYPPPFDLITLAETTSVKLTDIQYATHKETRTLLWIYGADEYGDTKEINVDRLGALFVPRVTEIEGEKSVGTPYAQFLTPNSPIEALWASLEKTVRLYLTNHNIALKNFELGATPAGVESLKFSAGPLEKEQKDIRNVRRIDEHNIFDITRIVWNYNAKDKISWDTEFKVDFGEPKEINDQETDLRIMQQKINMGLTSLVEAKIEMNPDLNEDEAIEELKKIKEQEKLIKEGTIEAEIELKKAMGLTETKTGGTVGA